MPCNLPALPEESAMQFVDRYPIIVTDAFPACRDFWVRHLGFALVFENDWFVYLQADGASITAVSATPVHTSAGSR